MKSLKLLSMQANREVLYKISPSLAKDEELMEQLERPFKIFSRQPTGTVSAPENLIDVFRTKMDSLKGLNILDRRLVGCS